MTKAPALTLPALDPETTPTRTGTGYSEPFGALCASRRKKALGTALGLTQFGVNLTTLPPGSASAQRHWHSSEDEFI